MKHLFHERNVRGFPDEPLLAATQTKGVVRKDQYEARTVLATKDLQNLKLVEVGDFVISLRSFQGGIEYARHRGIISPAYTVLYPEQPDAHGYFASLLKSQPFISGLSLYVTGIRQGQNIDFVKLGRSTLPVPTPEEQNVICAFAQDLEKKVNRFIRNRRRLIEVLNEQKQAIVHYAVTRGLNASAPLKPSGIEWLPEIPGQWRVVPLRHLGHVQTGVTLGKNYGQQRTVERPYLRVANVQSGGLELSLVKTIRVPSAEAAASELRSGDVLMTEGGDIDKLGRGCVWRGEIAGCLHQNHIFAMRVNHTLLLPEYLQALMASPHGRTYFELTAKRTTNLASTNSTKIGAFPIPLPTIEEQTELLHQISHSCSALDALKGRAEREISLVREYRTRLIADVVTGKVDVRNLASVDAPVAGKANIHFRRAIFAAEIVHRLHDDPTFGHVKFEKTIFMCEKCCRVETGSTYARKAAGPYDNRALRSIDAQLAKQKWYGVEKREKRYRYLPMERAGQHRIYFDRYFGTVSGRFDEVIELLRPLDTRQCEIVATLYSAWEDLLSSGEASDDQIIDQVLHHWHPSKQVIKEGRWRSGLAWMKRKGLTPEKGNRNVIN